MWPFRSKNVVGIPEKQFRDALDRVHRLEIALTENLELVDRCHRALKRAEDRANGALGGRPSHRNGAASLDEVPKGDKAGLRQHFAGELAARQRGIIPRE